MSILIVDKNEHVKLTYNFSSSEFNCSCAYCDKTTIDFKLIERLEAIRNIVNKPVLILSGYRCFSHQNELTKIGFKTAKNSTHTQGRAADISIHGMSGHQVERVARLVGFKAVGVADTWVHVDMRDDKERRWAY